MTIQFLLNVSKKQNLTLSLGSMSGEENVTVKDGPPQIDPLDRSGNFVNMIIILLAVSMIPDLLCQADKWHLIFRFSHRP